MIPVALDSDGADLAVGCTYKYLNGGPSAPAFLYVRSEHQPQLRQPIWGWLGRREPFEMAPGHEPADGIAAMLSGTPPVLGLTAVSVGAELVIEAGIEAVRHKAAALTEFAIELTDSRRTSRAVGYCAGERRLRRDAQVVKATNVVA